MFNASTVAQMAAFFADKESAAKINILKLMKLMYLADRESMHQHGFPISFDEMVSMPHGPVLSGTLNLINGFVSGKQGSAWDSWMSTRANHMVAARRKFSRNDFDRISQADWEVLQLVWQQFGEMNQWELRAYTHQHCSEWRDPISAPTKALPISELDVLTALGIKKRMANALAKEIKSAKSLSVHFAQQ